jgi:hypothetical protein
MLTGNKLKMKERPSQLRLKIWLLTTIGVVGLLAPEFINMEEGAEAILMVIAGIAATMFFFVRCEICKTPVVSGRWKLPYTNMPMLVSWRTFFPEKRCPVCGKERY